MSEILFGALQNAMYESQVRKSRFRWVER